MSVQAQRVTISFYCELVNSTEFIKFLITKFPPISWWFLTTTQKFSFNVSFHIRFEFFRKRGISLLTIPKQGLNVVSMLVSNVRTIALPTGEFLTISPLITNASFTRCLIESFSKSEFKVITKDSSIIEGSSEIGARGVETAISTTLSRSHGFG